MERESYTSWTARNWREGFATIVTDKEQVDLCVRTFQDMDIQPREKPPEKVPAPNRPVGRSRPPLPTAPERRYLENTRAFPALAQPVPASGISCSLCEQEGHRPSACQRYTTVTQRRRRLEEQGRCLRCLRQDHVTRDCSRQDRCSKCKATDHHFLLCPSIDPPGRTNNRQENRERNGNASHNVSRATGANAELTWDTPSDCITFGLPKDTDTTATRRSVLSIIASTFDPLGLVGPCLLPAKRLFQRLWGEGTAWDAPLPDTEALSLWQNQTIVIPRHSILGKQSRLQLHVFCDASEHTFAAAVYIRSETADSSQSNLLFAKNRLRPRTANQRFTIPRLELLAILVGIRAMRFAEKELRRPIDGRHLWSDSQIALSWVKSDEPKAQFEQRRLVEIRQGQPTTFHFVRTDQNPADVATKGLHTGGAPNSSNLVERA